MAWLAGLLPPAGSVLELDDQPAGQPHRPTGGTDWRYRKLQVESALQQQKYERLAAAWNEEVMRSGDQVNGMAHDNVWATPGFLKFAWRQVGQSGPILRGKNDVHASNRGLEALSTLAASWSLTQQQELDSLSQQWTRDDAVFVRCHYDGTPMLFSFGHLQSVVEPHARYLIQVKDQRGFQRWKPVPYEEYKSLCPKAKTNSGVLEVQGQLADVYWTRPSMQGVEEHRKITRGPKFLQKNNADCISDSMGQECPMLGLDGTRELCLQVKWVFLSQFPDEAASNVRQHAYWEQELKPVKNALFTKGACMLHKLHRVIAKSTKESTLIGHCHAVATVQADTSRRNAMQRATKAFIAEHLHIVHGEPDPYCARMQEALLSHTILRELEHTQGSECNMQGQLVIVALCLV